MNRPTHAALRVLAVLVAATCTAGVAGALDLQAALRAAEAEDPTLAAARANRDGALENLPLARARLLPQLSLQASENRLRQETTTQNAIFGPQTTEFNGPSRNAQLVLRQTLYRPRDKIGVDIGALQVEYGKLKLESATSDLWLRTTGAWLDLLSATSQLDAGEEVVPAVERAAAQARARLASGDGTRDAVVEAEAQVAAARARLFDSQAIVAARQSNLALITNQALASLVGGRLPQLLPAPLAADDGEYVALVLARNPELRAAEVVRIVADLRVRQVGADSKPTIDFVASAVQAANDTSSTLGSRYRIGQYGVQLSVPLYTGGALSAGGRQAAAQARASASDRDAYAQQLRQRVTVLWQSERGLRERIVASSTLVESAREQLRAAEQGVRHGQRSIGDISNAATLVGSRQRDLVDLRQQLLSTQVQLLAMLPVDEPLWAGWIGQLESLASAR